MKVTKNMFKQVMLQRPAAVKAVPCKTWTLVAKEAKLSGITMWPGSLELPYLVVRVLGSFTKTNRFMLVKEGF